MTVVPNHRVRLIPRTESPSEGEHPVCVWRGHDAHPPPRGLLSLWKYHRPLHGPTQKVRLSILGRKLLHLQWGPSPWSPLTLLSLSPSCAFVTYEKMESADQAVAEVGISQTVLPSLLSSSCFFLFS